MDIFSEINNWIKDIATNPYVTVVGFIIGAVGLLYAIYIARRDRKVKILSYSLISSNMIENGQTLYPKLEVTYDGQKLDNFTTTKVGIYNEGTEVIRLTDIAPNDPIQISIPENLSLLEAALIKSSNHLNDFRIHKVSDRVVQIEFDYIEPYDSVTIQLLHTGKGSQPINISGTVIGAKKPFVPTRFKNLKDFSIVTNPMGKSLRGLIYALESKWLSLIVFIFLMLIFGIPSYYFFTSSNYLLGGICAIPTAFLLLAIISRSFRRETLAEKGLTTEAMRSMFYNVLSDSDKENDR